MYPDECATSCRDNQVGVCVNLNGLQALIQGLPKQECITSLEVHEYGISIRYNNNAIR